MQSQLLLTLLATLACVHHCKSANYDCDGTTNVRLQGGRTVTSGRVEVCKDGEWQTLCDQSFNSNDATVVCRELGFSDEGAFSLNNGFDKGLRRQSILRINTQCDGSESSILECPSERLRWLQRLFCRHSDDVGVSCQLPNEGDLRLRGGSTPNSGRIEVYANDTWGTVCTDFWSQKDAQVACRRLGFSDSGAQAVRFGYEKLPSSDPTPILLDNLVCSGDEDSLVDCRHNGIGIHNCNHDQDAGLACSNESAFETFLRGLMMAEMEEALSDTAKEVESQSQYQAEEETFGDQKESTFEFLKELKDLLDE